jgi:hypothetical protein
MYINVVILLHMQKQPQNIKPIENLWRETCNNIITHTHYIIVRNIYKVSKCIQTLKVIAVITHKKANGQMYILRKQVNLIRT